ncbi:hypothetical protein NXS19_012513 [Fusarium pseudograminearum]|nr:hypothetical protein NXS19_012513 [Fusarium pseudograminearum]
MVCHHRKQLGAVEARRAHNPEVTGSKPVAATLHLFLCSPVTFLVRECREDIVDMRGIWTVLSSAYQYSWLPTAWGHVLLFKAALVVQIPVLAN